MFQGRGTFGGHYGMGASDWATYFTMNNDASRGWIWRRVGSGNIASLRADGLFMCDASIRTPIFYDSDNTGYYLDAASTSVFNRISTVRADNWLYLDYNYGHSVVGVYSSTRFQGVWAMGDSYKLSADGTSTGSLYGIAWSYPSAGGAASNLASHGMLILENGVFKGAWGGGRLVTPEEVRGTVFREYSDTAYYVDPSSGGTCFNGGGNILTAGNITAYYSDERLKTKLGTIENALDKIKSLSGFYYEANETAQKLGFKKIREVGVSAQEVEKILPEIVKPAPVNNDYLTIDYERLVPLLIEAIKEQDGKMKEMEKTINSLTEMVTKLLER
jgi:hypothetical protein